MRPRFLADANLDQDIVRGLRKREPGVDFITAHDANLAGLGDPVVLALAADHGRILVSHDKRSMPHHLGRFLESGQHSAGVIILPQEGDIGQAIDALQLVWAATDSSEWVDQIEYLPWPSKTQLEGRRPMAT